MTIDRTPVFNLNVVLKATSLKADVLRAWERRYQLPLPRRSAGGHRLYSAYDIETVRWLKARQAEGLSISRAVELWRETLQAGRDPLAGSDRAESSVGTAPITDTRIDSLRNLWLEACLNFSDNQAEEALNQAFGLYPVETVCTDILQQGLSLIGESWYCGKASVQQEHFASALVARRLETLIAATPLPTRRQTVLVGCPPDEWHTIPALMFCLFLRRKGLKVVYLGGNVPVRQIEETALAIQPDLMIMAAQQLTTAATLQSIALSLENFKGPLAYGGLIFSRVPGLCERIPAHFLGESLAEGMQAVEQLLAAPTPLQAPIQPEDSILESARRFREIRPLIERALTRELQQAGMQYTHKASAHFTAGLAAALELGNPSFLEADLEWASQYLSGQQIPGERLYSFLAAFRQIIFDQMGEGSLPITRWIDAYLLRNKPDDLNQEKQ